MSTEAKQIIKELKAASSSNQISKITRFMLNLLSSVPTFGGVFSATSAAWSEAEQSHINQLVVQLIEITDDKVETIENSLVSSSDYGHVIVGHITFNPNTAQFIESSKISSITDNGVLDFTVSFTQPYSNYIFNYYGSGPIALKCVQQNCNGVRLLFESPAPDLVRIIFFEPQPTKPNGSINSDWLTVR